SSPAASACIPTHESSAADPAVAINRRSSPVPFAHTAPIASRSRATPKGRSQSRGADTGCPSARSLAMAGSAPPAPAPPPIAPIAVASPPALHLPRPATSRRPATSEQIAIARLRTSPKRCRERPLWRSADSGAPLQEARLLPHTRGSEGQKHSSRAAALADTNNNKTESIPRLRLPAPTVTPSSSSSPSRPLNLLFRQSRRRHKPFFWPPQLQIRFAFSAPCIPVSLALGTLS